MKTFETAVEAKEFFASKVVEQARRDGTPFDRLEREMLYFTETGTDAKREYLKVAAEFEEKHDSARYEEKVSRLLKTAYEHDLKEAGRSGQDAKDTQEIYRSAFEALSKEDHYVAIMIENALGSRLRRKWLGLF